MRLIRDNAYLVIISSCLFFLFLCLFSLLACAETIYVDESGSGDFTSIQDAIDSANESDIIHVYSGTYSENLFISKSVHIQGDDKDSTVIKGVQSASDHTVKVTADNVSIEDVTLSNELRQNQDFPCVFVDSATDFVIDSCILTYGERGIYLQYAINAEISDCIIQNNDQKGVKLYFADGCFIHDNQIRNNGDGVRLHGSDGNMIYQNSITGNGYGILVSASVDNVFYENEFSANSAGNAEDTTPGSNSWSYNQKGNYWDDYDDYDTDSDGVGDTAYLIPGGDNVDSFPLGVFLTQSFEPVASIDSIHPSPATEGVAVSFQGHGVDEDGDILDWEWVSSIDGVLHSSSADFSSSSLSVGMHTIRFRVQDDDNQWSPFDETTLTIQGESEDNQAPTSSIVTVNPTEVEEGEEVYFHGFGSDSDGMITGYQWSSSIDGVLSSESTFTTTSLSVGTHSITFKVKDNNGVWSSVESTQVKITKPNIPNTAPVADSNGPYTGVVNTSVLFDASDSYDSDDQIQTFSWKFGDGKSGFGEKISHTYSIAGEYTVNLTVIDSFGSSSKDTTIVTIQEPSDDSSPPSNNDDDSSVNDDSSIDQQDTPGFGFLLLVFSIIFCFLLKKRTW